MEDKSNKLFAPFLPKKTEAKPLFTKQEQLELIEKLEKLNRNELKEVGL